MRLDKLVRRLCALLNAANALGVRIRTGGSPPCLRVFWPVEETNAFAWIRWDDYSEQWVMVCYAVAEATGTQFDVSDAQREVLDALLEQTNRSCSRSWGGW